ncbi:MAG: hypothetical protein LBG71_06070 [Clostridiales Family XIII bacterium]|jgi:hypothetical protein|nr:hypothetical protein [Clostridiales Family XIII bacterium]
MADEKKTLMKKMKAKKDVLLRAAMLLFVLAYPLTYFGAGSGQTPVMAAALAVTGLGSLVAALL